jgi:pyrimidine operon attenuation protein/uracil phosphoribosyltransferase
MPIIMDADRMGRTLTRIAHEILERNRSTEHLALVGIRTRGDVLARRRFRSRLTTRKSCSWTTCSTRGARFAPRSTR